MSPREVGHRLAEQSHGVKERFASRANLAKTTGTVSAERSLALLRGPNGPASVLLPAGSRESLLAAHRSFFPGRYEELPALADRICCGNIRLFGEDVSFPNGCVDWHTDWATGEHFPLDFYRDIAKLDLARTCDLKRVWETNRQQFLVTLGQAYFLTGRERYAESALDRIDSWIQGNPPYRGANWMEALEVSFRLCSWVWTLALVGDTPSLTAERAQRFLASIQTQRVFIERHLSTYSSPNTHLLGEAMGLFLVGVALDGLEGSTASVARAQEIMEQELDRQFAPDGSHREQSAYYHAYATDMYLLPTLIGRRRGMPFPVKWTKRLEQMCEYLVRLCRPNGELARFGDDDGGRAVRFAEEDYYRPRSLGALGALLFERGQFKPSDESVPEEVFWLLGTEGVERYADTSNHAKTRVPARFPNAGFAVLPESSASSRFWLACLGKPMGMMTAGHSHAAPLSFELALDGIPILVDPGTYTYQAGPPWRDFFRGPASHNVLELEDAERFVPSGPFNWKDKDLVQPAAMSIESGELVMGYAGRDQSGRVYRHTRVFSCPSPKELRMEDRIDGSGTHHIHIRLQFAPNCCVESSEEGAFIARCGDVELRIVDRTAGLLRAMIRTGSLDPLAGWYSPRYGLKVAAPALCLEGEAQLPASFIISFAVHSSAPTSTTAQSESAEKTRTVPAKGSFACAES